MITAKKPIINYIKHQSSVSDFAKRMGVTRQTIYNILQGRHVSSSMVARLLERTGFDFEKAFNIK